MTRKNILILIVTILIIPQITLAAWWNPFTWNKKESLENIQQISEVRNVEPYNIEIQKDQQIGSDISSSTINNINTANVEPKVVEKIVEKIVTKTVPVEKIVTVQDQNLLKEIESLKVKVNELQLKNNQCFNIQRNIDEIEMSAQKAKDDLAKYIKDAEDKANSAEGQKKAIETKMAQIDLEMTKTQIDFDNCNNTKFGCDNQTNYRSKMQSLKIEKAELQLELSKL